MDLPEIIFARMDKETAPTPDYLKQMSKKIQDEWQSIEDHYDKDIMMVGCVHHPREWFGLYKQPVKIGVYKLVEVRTIAPLTARDTNLVRIPDKFL